MKCLKCGTEMTEGTIIGHGQGAGAYYEFTSEEEKKSKTGFKKIFRETTVMSTACESEYPAWHCPKCKKLLLWMDCKD